LGQTPLMHCSRCGVCCEKTEMLLSKADINNLEKLGYHKGNFVLHNRHGLSRLRNRNGHCVFFDIKRHYCKVYRHRPLGCRLYPIIYSEEEGIIVDDLCPTKNTVTHRELERKGRKLIVLLQEIDSEAKKRFYTKPANSLK
jgi:Fe-S-cluster containining protein